ncbi:MAG: flagellar hook-length control protein FliK [Planctomycetota bacterium]
MIQTVAEGPKAAGAEEAASGGRSRAAAGVDFPLPALGEKRWTSTGPRDAQAEQSDVRGRAAPQQIVEPGGPGAPQGDKAGQRLPLGEQPAPWRLEVHVRQEGGGGGGASDRPPDFAARKGELASPGRAAAEGALGWRQYAAEAADTSPPAARQAVRQAAGQAEAAIVRQAQYIQRNGSSEITLRLHPPELGRLRVAVEMREGKLEVRIRAEDPQVREALKLDLEDLMRSLRDAQLDLARLEVSDYQLGPRHGGRDGGGQEDAPGAGASAFAEPTVEEGHGTSTWAVFTEGGGIDCLV